MPVIAASTVFTPAPAGGTDLTVTSTTTNVTVVSSTGTDAVLPTATATEAGVMSAAAMSKLDSMVASRGSFATLAALVAAHPAGVAGDNAILTNGTGGNASTAIWDTDNTTPGWVDTGVAPITGLTFSAQATAPASPVAGAQWLNTGTAIASSIAPGARAFWTGSAWRQIDFGSYQTTHAATTIAVENTWTVVNLASIAAMSSVDEKFTTSGNAITIPTAGDYLIGCQAILNLTGTATTGALGVAAGVGINGANPTAFIQAVSTLNNAAYASITPGCTMLPRLFTLAANATVDLRVFCGANGSTTAKSIVPSQCYMTIARVK